MVIAVVLIGGYAIYASQQKPEDAMMLASPAGGEDEMQGEAMENKTAGDKMMEKDEAMMGEDDKMMGDKMMKFSGTVLAGTSAPLLDFNKSDFDKALASDKLIVLYFYANWCPICRVEFPKMQAAFNDLETDKVVAFRVNYNDNETDQSEIDLAREHGVAYQHTKVFVKNRARILKSPESWEKARYAEEINKAL